MMSSRRVRSNQGNCCAPVKTIKKPTNHAAPTHSTSVFQGVGCFGWPGEGAGRHWLLLLVVIALLCLGGRVKVFVLVLIWPDGELIQLTVARHRNPSLGRAIAANNMRQQRRSGRRRSISVPSGLGTVEVQSHVTVQEARATVLQFSAWETLFIAVVA
jgi:hypothetical protein